MKLHKCVHFHPRCLVEMTHNKLDSDDPTQNCSQGQTACIVELPDNATLREDCPTEVAMAPNGTGSLPVKSNSGVPIGQLSDKQLKKEMVENTPFV